MAAVLTVPKPAMTGYSKTSRRQYQACDQCRKSRRACDAGTLRVADFPFREVEQHLDSSAPTSEACSNCTRTNKRCTFVWLTQLPLQDLPKGVKRKLESTSLPSLVSVATAVTKYQIPPHKSELLFDPSMRPSLLPTPDAFHLSQGSKPSVFLKYQIPATYASAEHAIPYTSTSLEARYAFDSVAPCTATSFLMLSTSLELGRDGRLLQDLQPKRVKQANIATDYSENICTVSPSNMLSSTSAQSTIGLSCKASQALPALSVNQVRFADKAMKETMATGLYQIYHDSFQTSVSCWVIEKNCPYETELADLSSNNHPASSSEEAAVRIGDDWPHPGHGFRW